MNSHIQVWLGGVIICCLVGIVFPPSFFLAAWFAFKIYADVSPKASATSNIKNDFRGLPIQPKLDPLDYRGLRNLSADDEGWLNQFYDFCESPAEVAFLEAMVKAYSLTPDAGKLIGKGLSLRMQVEVGHFRTDFIIGRRLVVEVDGAAWHSSAEAIENDEKRDTYLKRQGYEVLRIPAKIPLYKPDVAVEMVRHARSKIDDTERLSEEISEENNRKLLTEETERKTTQRKELLKPENWFRSIGATVSVTSKSLVELNHALTIPETKKLNLSENNDVSGMPQASISKLSDVTPEKILATKSSEENTLPKDVTESLEWFENALSQGNMSARQFMNDYTDGDKYWPQNPDEAFRFLEYSAVHGDPNAQYNLGLRYAYGQGAIKNEAKAIRWFRAASQWFEAASDDGEYEETLERSSAPENISKALKWCQQAAEKGSPDAQLVCGMILSGAQGMPPKLSESFIWFKRAADQGNDEAQYRLGEMYKQGNGVQKSNRRAFDWYLRAVEEKWHPDAMFNLAEMCRLGEGTDRNLSEAYKWYVAADNHAGHPEARNRAGIMLRDGTGVAQDYAMARECFLSAAMNGVNDAMFNLGMMCATGEGGSPDYREAISWVMPAADGGHPVAQEYLDYLKQFHKGGNGAPLDQHEAFEWFVRAAEHGHVKARRSLKKI